MNDLLQFALEAHGGIERWNRYESVALELSVSGALWDLKGLSGLFHSAKYETNLRVQQATLGRFGPAAGRVKFAPQQLILENSSGKFVEIRDNPRSAFAGHSNETQWDLLHAAYFQGYAMWTYVTLPFLYSYPGFIVEEIDPWQEDGETWRRLKITFPGDIATHTRQQVSYFGPDGLLRRHDYTVDVLGGARGAHYVEDYREHDGIMIPHRRRVYSRDDDNMRVASPILVAIDIREIIFAPAISM